jgi:hypothetical protein
VDQVLSFPSVQVILLRLDWYSTEVQTGSTSPPNEASGHTDSSQESILISNSKALASRFIQLFCRPGQLAPVILDFLSMALSIIWTERQPGPDLLYPFSSLKKQKSGRLARLLLEDSRDQLHNLHHASSPRDDVDPPRVAVIDLDEVPPEIIERGYVVSADFYGFVVVVLLLEVLITLFLHTSAPINGSEPGGVFSVFKPYIMLLLLFMSSPSDFNPRLRWFFKQASFRSHGGAVIFASLFITIVDIFINIISPICLLCVYAVFRGEGTLTLVRRSDISSPGCAVLLDRDFAVILTGTQNVVEAIAESSFSMSHTLKRRYQLAGSLLAKHAFYEAFKTLCQGLPFAILAGFLLLLGPTSFSIAFVPFVLPVVAALLVARAYIVQEARFHSLSIIAVFLTRILNECRLSRCVFQHTIWIHLIPPCFLMIHFISSQNFHIRTAKLLDILGHPPVQKWEFDTLAAAATFQCLVLCRDIPRPVKSFDVLTLLDTFVPDQTDVWKVWKARVADRIAHEEDISFAPTVPSFGDDRQIFLKGLLDEAQTGFGMYRDFYDQHVPLYSTIAL